MRPCAKWGSDMAKFTERLDIKMTPEDMALLAAASLKAKLPLTVYARELILRQLNPIFRGSDETSSMESRQPRTVED